jgi:hypothetical protein
MAYRMQAPSALCRATVAAQRFPAPVSAQVQTPNTQRETSKTGMRQSDRVRSEPAGLGWPGKLHDQRVNAAFPGYHRSSA